MLTTRQFARTINRPYTTVMTWLQKGLIPDVQEKTTDYGKYYLIPAELAATFQPPTRMGRPKKPKPVIADAQMQADAELGRRIREAEEAARKAAETQAQEGQGTEQAEFVAGFVAETTAEMKNGRKGKQKK